MKLARPPIPPKKMTVRAKFGGRKRWGGVSNHSSDFCSKKVPASFSNCDHAGLELIANSLRLMHFFEFCHSPYAICPKPIAGIV